MPDSQWTHLKGPATKLWNICDLSQEMRWCTTIMTTSSSTATGARPDSSWPVQSVCASYTGAFSSCWRLYAVVYM